MKATTDDEIVKEFKETFKVGDMITCDEWEKNRIEDISQEILYIGKKSFILEADCDELYAEQMSNSRCNWKLAITK